MGVQFILFLGIDVGINMLLQRQRGLWKRLRAAPLSRSMLLGSRAASAALISMLIMILLFAFARVVFGVRIAGSRLGFLGVCAAFGLMTATFGLLIAALGKTPEATRGLSVFVTLIMVMLGIVGLAGIVVKNAILLIEFTDELRAEFFEILNDMHAARRAPDVHRSHDDPVRCRYCGYRSECEERLA